MVTRRTNPTLRQDAFNVCLANDAILILSKYLHTLGSVLSHTQRWMGPVATPLCLGGYSLAKKKKKPAVVGTERENVLRFLSIVNSLKAF